MQEAGPIPQQWVGGEARSLTVAVCHRTNHHQPSGRQIPTRLTLRHAENRLKADYQLVAGFQVHSQLVISKSGGVQPTKPVALETPPGAKQKIWGRLLRGLLAILSSICDFS